MEFHLHGVLLAKEATMMMVVEEGEGPTTATLISVLIDHGQTSCPVMLSLITYLSRYAEFTDSEQMKRVVNLLHRQAVKTKAAGLFFKVRYAFPSNPMHLTLFPKSGFYVESLQDTFI